MVLDKGVSYLSWLAPQEEECALRKEFARAPQEESVLLNLGVRKLDMILYMGARWNMFLDTLWWAAVGHDLSPATKRGGKLGSTSSSPSAGKKARRRLIDRD
ncbi:hypothetical protein ACFE04_019651 [Oxalis oulophora]